MGIKKWLTSLGCRISPSRAASESLSEGAGMPGVSQKNQDGQVVEFKGIGSTGFVLVYFYPKSDTPGCTRQACSLRDAFEILTEKGVTVLGVSADSVKAQRAFKDKYSLPFDLIADEDATVTAAFGVPTTLGFAKRQAFLFRDGKLVWKDLAAATDKQAADLLEYLGE